jgi:BlaI family transcriptional regulator, penicillinase repressor
VARDPLGYRRAVLSEIGPRDRRPHWHPAVLQPRDGELAYTTALSLLQTMEQKGLVGHDRRRQEARPGTGQRGKGQAMIPWSETVRDWLVDNIGLTTVVLIAAFAAIRGLARALQSEPTPEELDNLERMIADAKQLGQLRGNYVGGGDETVVRDTV